MNSKMSINFHLANYVTYNLKSFNQELDRRQFLLILCNSGTSKEYTQPLLPPAQAGTCLPNAPGVTDTRYKEKQYTCGEAPDYDRSHWLDVKSKLDLDFPNLPYLMGENKLTQSNAILHYIACKHSMCGDTEDKIGMDIMENQTSDFHLQLVRLCCNWL